MLETKKLCKTYKPKKGVPVKALDQVSLRFPDHGMVFLLGKSGSGKSTLLNVLGGLDRYDSGEIIIKGVSSAKFRQQHFDSYRNTYVGFIFQEYNILEEFSVGANVALAIELQGKKATDEQINRILSEVDLAGYGNRKPNELSGGQKQRVAIARALVKNPEIIMADEPTGALDSATGKQVLNTLKKLSENKLVIVVSHDREFAEKYADRIIELSDGRVIRDVTAAAAESIPAEEQTERDSLTFRENTVEIPAAYHLTEEDRVRINSYIDSLGANQPLTLTVNAGQNVRSRFAPTDTAAISDRSSTPFRLIRSKLPLKSAFRIGADGLKHKKIKLVFTILLSCIAFTLFGLTDTFGSYNHIRACTQSLIDSEINYVSLQKKVKIRMNDSEESYFWRNGGRLTDQELAAIEKDTGIHVKGVYIPSSSDGLGFGSQINRDAKLTETNYNIFMSSFTGLSELTASDVEQFGYTLLAGRLPDGSSNEIAVSKYIYATFEKASWCPAPDNDSIDLNPAYTNIKTYNDLIGKTIRLSGTDYTVTGVIDTGFDIDRFLPLTVAVENEATSDSLIRYALFTELQNAVRYGMDAIAFVGEGHVSGLIRNRPGFVTSDNDFYLYYTCETGGFQPMNVGTLQNLSGKEIKWLNPGKTSLEKNEILISSDLVTMLIWDMDFSETSPDGDALDSKITDTLKNLNFSVYTAGLSYGDDEIRIAGIISSEDYPDCNSLVIVDNDTFSTFGLDASGIYTHAVGAMPKNRAEIGALVKYAYNNDGDVRYALQNSVTYELDTVQNVLTSVAKVFLYIGLFFAVFASILMANFIATSISYKKQEIGILRAIGSRSNDVFRIFFSESFIIAMINFVLSSIGTLAITLCINAVIRSETGLLITILNFGIRQLALLLAVSIAVAAIASFLPVRKIAAKRPIDAIRNR